MDLKWHYKPLIIIVQARLQVSSWFTNDILAKIKKNWLVFGENWIADLKKILYRPKALMVTAGTIDILLLTKQMIARKWKSAIQLSCLISLMNNCMFIASAIIRAPLEWVLHFTFHAIIGWNLKRNIPATWALTFLRAWSRQSVLSVTCVIEVISIILQVVSRSKNNVFSMKIHPPR